MRLVWRVWCVHLVWCVGEVKEDVESSKISDKGALCTFPI